jgi:hypothetical protein
MSPARFTGYLQPMNDKRFFLKNSQAGFVLGAALLTTLVGCTTYVDRPSQGSVYVAPPTVVYVAPPVVQDDYIYYPDYQVYYSSHRHQYAYMEGGAWVSRPAPRGVSVNVLIASPSVRMNFHDAPANHHAEIVRQYPRNWRPPGPNQGQQGNHNDEPHGGNNGR